MTVKKLADLDPAIRARLEKSGMLPEDEIVDAEFENCTMYFSVEELGDEFFGGLRVADALFQKYADTLAANLDVVSDYDGELVTIDRGNFNDSFGDMMADLHEDFIKDLNRRHDALYRIALAQWVINHGATLGDEEIKAWYDAHPADFTRPESVTIEYVEVDGSAVANPVGGGDYAQAAPAGVAIDPRLDIVFNSLGCLSASAACPDGAAAQTAGIGGVTFRVHAATGFIESLP